MSISLGPSRTNFSGISGICEKWEPFMDPVSIFHDEIPIIDNDPIVTDYTKMAIPIIKNCINRGNYRHKSEIIERIETLDEENLQKVVDFLRKPNKKSLSKFVFDLKNHKVAESPPPRPVRPENIYINSHGFGYRLTGVIV